MKAMKVILFGIKPRPTNLSSNRKGANNVFTISKNGGVPKQLTYYPTADIPYDWTASNNIVFATTRVLKGPEWMNKFIM